MLFRSLVLALQAAHDAVDGGEEVLFRNEFLVVARGDQRGLVADVGDVRDSTFKMSVNSPLIPT